MTATQKKKLIEVALPLEAINRSRRARSRSGTAILRRCISGGRAGRWLPAVPSCGLRWSTTPPAIRTSSRPKRPRPRNAERLFRILEQLVLWENSNNEQVLKLARDEIMKSTDGNPPPVLDPFCGGGSIPLEAQRLGLEAHASDLNPVAVLITKALIEIPPKFANMPPVIRRIANGARALPGRALPGSRPTCATTASGCAMRRRSASATSIRKLQLPKEYGGGEATVIAWLWARTVKCPNPACGAQMPLVRSFALSTKKGKEAWVEPIIDHENKTVRFEVRTGKDGPPEGTVNRGGATCIVCGTPVPFSHVRASRANRAR